MSGIMRLVTVFINGHHADIAINFQNRQLHFRNRFYTVLVDGFFQFVFRNLDFLQNISEDLSVFNQNVWMVFYQFFDKLAFEDKFLDNKIRNKQHQSRNNATLQTAIGANHRILNRIAYQQQKNHIASIEL